MKAKKEPDHLSELCEAFLTLKTKEECRRFLLDLCTPAELEAFEERWRIARLLKEDRLSYREIHAETDASLTTIGRVARFLLQEKNGGYALVLKRLKTKR